MKKLLLSLFVLALCTTGALAAPLPGGDSNLPVDVTAARGGEGAVREAVEFLLAARRDGKNPADLWTKATGPAKI